MRGFRFPRFAKSTGRMVVERAEAVCDTICDAVDDRCDRIWRSVRLPPQRPPPAIEAGYPDIATASIKGGLVLRQHTFDAGNRPSAEPDRATVVEADFDAAVPLPAAPLARHI